MEALRSETMLRCSACGRKAMAVEPGMAETRFAKILVSRGKRDRAWCRVCWLREFGQPAATLAIKREVKRGNAE